MGQMEIIIEMNIEFAIIKIILYFKFKKTIW